ncbi:MAG: alpha/beta fold hydrolase [Proteobacteria bacterium]|nr:alpha/beta fold hydrolase [Pseudomonadota bacterium]
MAESLPVVLIPGLLCSARLYASQIPALWSTGPVMVAEHTRDDSMAGIARRILATAPPRFALVGLSMGGYISFELLRQAPQRVVRLALLDTAARPDTAEATAGRRTQMALASNGRFEEVIDALYPRLVHASRGEDDALRELNRQMGRETGVSGYLNQQAANIARPDSRPTLAAIRCPTLVLVGDADQLTPPDRAEEIANGVRGAKLLVVPRCGHLSTLEQPEAVTAALLRLLQD